VESVGVLFSCCEESVAFMSLVRDWEVREEEMVGKTFE